MSQYKKDSADIIGQLSHVTILLTIDYNHLS